MTIVAALTAILLGHCRHHSPRQRPALSKLHSVHKSHRRIVPRSAVINFGRGRSAGIDKPWQEFGHVGTRERGNPFLQAKYPGKQTIEPGPLLNRERGRFGNERRNWGALRYAHAASRSASALSASISCRRAKAMKLSSRAARFFM